METRLLEYLTELKELENEYFKKFNEYFPTFITPENEGVFGPSELYEMAIEAQVLLTSLGPTAVKRLNYVGFDLLFPFLLVLLQSSRGSSCISTMEVGTIIVIWVNHSFLSQKMDMQTFF